MSRKFRRIVQDSLNEGKPALNDHMQECKSAFRPASLSLDELKALTQPVSFIRAAKVCFQILKGVVDDSFVLLFLAYRYAIEQDTELGSQILR